MKEDDCGLGKNGKRIRLTGFRSRRRRRRQNEDDFVTGRKQRQSIAQLLYDRECGRNSTNFLKQAPLYEEWKPFVCRNIPFSKLQTPFTDAIISLDSNGSYMMSLGGTSIRFYGVPSPSSLQKKNSNVVSPPLGSVPLLYHNRNNCNHNRNGTMPSAIFGEDEVSIASTIPVQILTTNDNRLGVAMFFHSSSALSDIPTFPDPILASSPAIRDVDCLGTIVFFLLPSPCGYPNGHVQYRLENVRLNGWNAPTTQNLFWKSQIIPSRHTTHNHNFLLDSYYKTHSGYIFFNDEDDGFRIIWIDLTFWSNIQPKKYTISIDHDHGNYYYVENLLTKPDDGGGTQSLEGLMSNICPCQKCGLFVPQEAYLRIDTLFRAILKRRRHHKSSSLPEFEYNLISFDSQHQTVKLNLVFANHLSAVPASLGIYVKVHLLTSSYQELSWVQHPSKRDPLFLKQWSQILAIHARRKERLVQSETFLSSVTTGHDPKAQDGSSLWNHVIHQYCAFTKTKNVDPKTLSMHFLYPFCDLVTNRAVINHCPVSYLQSNNIPLKLCYG